MPSERPDRTEREFLGRLAARVADEFGHLLERMRAHLDRLDDIAGDRAEVQDELADSRELVARGEALLHQVSAFAGERNLAPEARDLRALIGSWWPQLQLAVGPERSLELQLRRVPSVSVDTAALLLALENLCANAREACPPDSRIELRLHDEGQEVVIEVVDHGVGMSAEVRARACDVAFTTKARHMGLGLSAAAAIVEAHGGRVGLDSEPGLGTTVTLRLPVPASTPVTDRVRVLVVAPERLIVRWMTRSLTSKGCETRSAADVGEARRQLQDDWPELIVLDRNLGDGDARSFAVELALDRPGRPVLFASTRSQLRRDRNRALSSLPSTIQVLEKPYSTRRFDALVLRNLDELRARR